MGDINEKRAFSIELVEYVESGGKRCESPFAIRIDFALNEYSACVCFLFHIQLWRWVE